MRIGLISDTHGTLRPAVLDVFRGVDLILHAGDIGALDILTTLESIAPVHAVRGNTDGWEVLPHVRELLELELEGSRVVVVHGHKLGSPTPARLREAHPAAHVIVYGHTHRQDIANVQGTLVVNPGAAGPARFNLRPSVGVLTLERGAAPRAELVAL